MQNNKAGLILALAVIALIATVSVAILLNDSEDKYLKEYANMTDEEINKVIDKVAKWLINQKKPHTLRKMLNLIEVWKKMLLKPMWWAAF